MRGVFEPYEDQDRGSEKWGIFFMGILWMLDDEEGVCLSWWYV